MRKFLGLIFIVFVFVSCSFYKPYYIVNESKQSIKLDLKLYTLADTSRLILKYQPGIDRKKEFESERAKQLVYKFNEDSIISLEIPPRVTVLLTAISSPSQKTNNYAIAQHTFTQETSSKTYDEPSFMYELVGKHWYSLLHKEYFVYQ